MNSGLRILTFFVACLALIAVTLLMLFRWQGMPEGSSNSMVQSTTAKEAYGIARPVAQQWAGDAKLLSASAAWQPNGGAGSQPGEASWSLLFYSPVQSEVALISVVDQKATLTNASLTEESLNPEDADKWQIDSPDAIAQLLSVGGQQFLESEGSASLTLKLNLDNQATWKSTLFNKDSRRVFSVNIDAETGEVMEAMQIE